MSRQKYADFLALRNIVLELFDFFKSEKKFLMLVIALILIAVFIAPYSSAAMWFGFLLAAYSAVANDSIQTIGTFIVSNKNLTLKDLNIKPTDVQQAMPKWLWRFRTGGEFAKI